MIRRAFLIAFILLWFQPFCVAQTKKQIREFAIRSVTETVTNFENGKEKETFKAHFSSWDKKGNLVEEAGYNKDGSLKYRETRKFEDDREVEETEEYPAGKKSSDKPSYRKTVSTYAKDKKVSEQLLDKDGKILETTRFTYNNMGDKTEELTLDATGKTIGSVRYEYDNKGLRTLKSEFDTDENLKRKSSYQYTF